MSEPPEEDQIPLRPCPHGDGTETVSIHMESFPEMRMSTQIQWISCSTSSMPVGGTLTLPRNTQSQWRRHGACDGNKQKEDDGRLVLYHSQMIWNIDLLWKKRSSVWANDTESLAENILLFPSWVWQWTTVNRICPFPAASLHCCYC